jgi:hypothetical protein
LISGLQRQYSATCRDSSQLSSLGIPRALPQLAAVSTAILTSGNSEVVSITGKTAIVRIDIVRLAKSGDFQAEYEGSIPFTRSDLVMAVKRRLLVSFGREFFLRFICRKPVWG